jgi:hypothetical protein
MNRFEFVKELLDILGFGSKYALVMPYIVRINSSDFNEKVTKINKLIEKWQKK